MTLSPTAAQAAPPSGRGRRGGLGAAIAVLVTGGLVLGGGTASAATPTPVSDAQIARECGPAGPFCEFQRDTGTVTVVDDERAESGSGYLRLDTPAANDKATAITLEFAGKKLSEINWLQYRTLVEKAADTAFQAPSLTIEITPNQPGAPGFTSLVWEPYYSDAEITPGAWQQWTPSEAKGWWASASVTDAGTPNAFGFSTYGATYADVLAALPDAVVGKVGINQGGGNPGLTAGVDLLTVNDTIYDFDNAPAPASADLVVTLEAPAGTEHGTTFPVMLTMRNDGPDEATTVVSGITAPAGLHIIKSGDGSVTADGRTAVFLAVALAPGESVIHPVTMVVDDDAKGTLTIAGGAGSLDVADPDPANNAAVVHTALA